MTARSLPGRGDFVLIPTVCVGCGHPDPTHLHIAGCADAQRKLREPVRFARVEPEPTDQGGGLAAALAAHWPRLFRCSCGEPIKTRPLPDPGEREAVWAAHVAAVIEDMP